MASQLFTDIVRAQITTLHLRQRLNNKRRVLYTAPDCQWPCEKYNVFKLFSGYQPRRLVEWQVNGRFKSRLLPSHPRLFEYYKRIHCGPGSSVGIATDYGLEGPGIESRWGRDFPPVQTGPGAHPASCKMGTGSFPEVKCGRGVLLTTHTLLVPPSWKSRAIPLPTYWATSGL